MSPTSDSSGSKRIVVSGINGYIAMALGLEILRLGHVLVGTSRSEKHEASLRSGAYAPYGSRFVHVCVADISAPGAFDEALKGSDAFLHLASPIVESLSYSTSIATAVDSSLSALKSASLAGPQFQSFVYMSSIAAVLDRDRVQENPAYAFTEDNWNERSVRLTIEAEKSGETLHWLPWYSASKIAAERAISQYRQNEKPSFSISIILPSQVYGPPVLNGTAEGEFKLSISLEQIHALLVKGEAALIEEYADLPEPYVDVRDVVAMCMWLIGDKGRGDGQRYLAVAGNASHREMWSVIKESRSQVDPGSEQARGSGAGSSSGSDSDNLKTTSGWKDGQFSLKSTKAEKEMGIKFRSLEESVGDTCKALWQQGIKSDW